uniref:CCHC-type domain-containing protein n=1 Tax=Nicotiana tabacum TaxID=4097 RepID=A0A1S3ZA82_TOBAC|nr:PREDICTED: uncharacterized protein LOC107784646 [Nicotiana tabacum]
MATILNKTLPDLSKLEPLDGNKVDYVLFNDPPADVVAGSSNTANIVVADDAAKMKFENDNKTVRGLEKKYGVDDAGKKKYAVGKWIKFQMVDDKTIMEQVHEYENLTADVLNEGMFKGKQKKGQKKGHVKKQDYFNKPEGHIQKSKGPCYVCGKIGHKAFQCNQIQVQSLKNGGKSPVQANFTEGDDVIAVVVVEVNMVTNKTDWILDTGTSTHHCANKKFFHDFEESADGERVYMGNSTTARVMGKEFFEHVFPLKNNVPSVVPNNASISMSVNSHIVPSSSVTANEHENELRRSNRRKIEASFGPDFITTFLT